MLRMEQLGDWLVVEKLFWQVTDSIHAFLLSIERLSITFTSNNSLPFQYDLDVKKLLYATFYGGRKYATTETYTSHLFRCDKKSEFILIPRFMLPLASWMLKLPKIVSPPPPLPPFTSPFTPTPTRPCPSIHTHAHTPLSPHSHPRPHAPFPPIRLSLHTHTHTLLSPPLTSHFTLTPTPTLSCPP